MRRSAGISRGPRSRSIGRGADIEVAPSDGGWTVREAAGRRAEAVYPTRDEAIAAAQAMLRPAGGRMAPHERNGRVRESYTLGRQAFEKISAVEGIRIDPDMRRDLHEARERHPSAEEARRAIAAKYGTAEP